MKPTYRKKVPKRTLPVLLIFGGGVLLLATAIYLLASAPTTSAPQALSASITTPFPNVRRVSLADARAAYDRQTALFVDVRDAGSYAAGHVPGAVSIPLGELEQRLDELPKDRWIITYCT
jgi:3-mercaptopyruvate sulfurtransferase SseA